jgi:hypothetical protein
MFGGGIDAIQIPNSLIFDKSRYRTPGYRKNFLIDRFPLRINLSIPDHIEPLPQSVPRFSDGNNVTTEEARKTCRVLPRLHAIHHNPAARRALGFGLAEILQEASPMPAGSCETIATRGHRNSSHIPHDRPLSVEISRTDKQDSTLQALSCDFLEKSVVDILIDQAG